MLAETGLLASIYAVYLAAVVSPGPNTFIVTRLSLAGGRRPATVAVAGITLGNLGWLTLVLGGAHLLFERIPGLAAGLRVGGGLYLGWLGLRAGQAAFRGGDILARPGGSPAPESPFHAGLVTSLTNPNTLPFYLSLLGTTFAPAVPEWVRFAAAAGVLVLCFLWYGALAVGFSSEVAQAAYRRWTRPTNLLLAGLLLGFAARFLLAAA
jgi:threonine/homoserine/homoserine lactone efflux protein